MITCNSLDITLQITRILRSQIVKSVAMHKVNDMLSMANTHAKWT